MRGAALVHVTGAGAATDIHAVETPRKQTREPDLRRMFPSQVRDDLRDGAGSCHPPTNSN